MPDGVFRAVQRWTMQGERVWERRSRARLSNGTQMYVDDCEVAFNSGATGCSPVRYRYFRPLRRVGQRLYGIEEVHTQTEMRPRFNSQPYTLSSSPRTNFQMCTAGACLAYGTATTPPLEYLRVGVPAMQGAQRTPGLQVSQKDVAGRRRF